MNMGRRRDKNQHLPKSHTLPSSPTHSFSSSSSDFEFTISISPRKSSAALCPADELFYKGQILPLHHSRRLSMVLGSSSDTNTTASRDSSGSSTDSRSSFSSDLSQLLHRPKSPQPSSVNEDDIKCINNINNVRSTSLNPNTNKKPSKFSLSRFSSVFRKEPKNNVSSSSSAKRTTTSTSTAKEVISKYLKKVKPFYEKISQKQQPKAPSSSPTPTSNIMWSRMQARSCMKTDGCIKKRDIPISAHQVKANEMNNHNSLHSFAGNMRHRRGRSCIVAASCPSSMRSSPNHSRRNEFTATTSTTSSRSCSSSMEELQSAIQGAIAHCKSSMLQNKTIYGQSVNLSSQINQELL